MSRFVITRAWLAEVLSLADSAAEVSFPGHEARAVLRAAWKGMGYADAPAEVFDFVPSQNPNWLRYFEEQDKHDKQTAENRSKIRAVPKN